MKKNRGLQRKRREKHVSARRRAAAPATLVKMKLKKGDTVVVVSGKDKGKTGQVLQAFPRENRLVIEGVAIAKRHLRRTGPKQSGRIVERPMPVHASNVMLLDPESKKPTRVARSREAGKTVRIAKKSGSTLK